MKLLTSKKQKEIIDKLVQLESVHNDFECAESQKQKGDAYCKGAELLYDIAGMVAGFKGQTSLYNGVEKAIKVRIEAFSLKQMEELEDK